MPNPIVFLIVGGVAGYAVGSTKKDRGDRMRTRNLPIKVGPACGTWEIVDPVRANLLVRRAYIDGRLAGVTDPFQLTARALAQVAPSCRNKPESDFRSPGELDLYTAIFDSVGGLLRQDEVMPVAQLDEMLGSFNTWHDQRMEAFAAAQQGVLPEMAP